MFTTATRSTCASSVSLMPASAAADRATSTIIASGSMAARCIATTAYSSRSSFTKYDISMKPLNVRPRQSVQNMMPDERHNVDFNTGPISFKC